MMTQPVYHEALDTMARTIWGEARGESWIGKLAVAHVILNRVKADAWWGKDIEGVCRHPYQFSCWNEGDRNRPLLEVIELASNLQFRESLAAAAAATFNLEPDPTEGCTHFMTVSRRAKGWPASWEEPREPVCQIGVHLFFRGIR